MVDPKKATVSQTHEPPMTELEAVKDHAVAVRALVSWDRVGVLMDEGPHAVVTVLLKGDAVVSAARFCLSAAESVDALRAYNEMSSVPMELRCWQGHAMTGEHTRDLAELTTVWRESSGQGKEQAEEDWRAFFEEIETNTLRRGRGAGISVPTRNQVLLDALAFAPMPVFCVAWPVHRQRIALPSPQQIGRALRPIGARLNGTLRTVNDNEAVLRSLEGVGLWDAMATSVEQTAADILLQAHGEGYRAALFAMGLMPALIALGAKLGNKCEITPMLRYRENGLWYWPMNVPRGEFFTVEGLDQLSDREAELCLLLGLTAVPEAMRSTAESLGMGVVSVFARTEYLGNGALGHPDDGASFRQRMQELLHRLGDAHGVRRVHVLPCASNAACVFFGQSFDSYHPELVIYDFAPEGGCMVPCLGIANVNNESKVKAVGAVAGCLPYGE